MTKNEGPEAMESTPDTPTRSVFLSRRRHQSLRILARVATAIALVHPMATLLARWDWRSDLITHFQGPALFATIIAAALVLWTWPRFAPVLVGLALVQTVPLLRYEGRNPVSAAPSREARYRILMVNVLCENDRFEDLARLVRHERPDVVGLVEYSGAWLDGLADLRGEFPYRVDAPQGSKGLALWFRAPPLSIDPPRAPCPDGWPFLHATFEFGGRARHLWLIHPSSPFERQGLPELPALARQIRDAGGSSFVVGDMNSSEGSPRFSVFLEVTRLRDSRLGFGRQASWPLWFPYRIAIDHAFLSDDLAVVDRRLGPSIGSDHAPLIVDIAPASATKAARASKSE